MVRPARNRRKQLTPQSLSGVAEVCETRSLLCATGFEAPVDVVDTAVIDGSEVKSDVVAPEDGPVADEMLFSVGETAVSEEDFQLAVCNFMPMVVGETEEFAPELTEKTDVFEDVTLSEEATEFVDYENDTMPTDWDPSWGYRFLSMTAAPVEEMNGEVPAELQDTEITGEIVDLPLLESVDLPVVDDMMMYTMTIEDSLNPDDLLATCFSAPPTDEVTDSDVEPGVDGVDVKEDVVVTTDFVGEPTEDWTTIPPEILMTMVMRGHVSDSGDEEIVVDETTEDGSATDYGVVTLDGEEMWQTGVVDGTEDLPPIMYMFGAGGLNEDGGIEVVEGELPVDGEVPTDEIYTMTGTTDDIPVDLLPEDSELIFQTSVLEDVPSSEPVTETGDDPASPVQVNFQRSVFAVVEENDDAIGTLLSRTGSQTGSGSATPRTYSGPAIRTAPKLNAVASRRAVPPSSLPNLTSPLGNSDESEAVDSDDDSSESNAVSANTSSTSTSNDSANQQAANATATPANRARSIDLFMSRFHDEFFAS